MGTNIDAPAPRNYGAETAETLQAQLKLAPDLYAAEAQYAPMYQDLQMQMLAKAAPELMRIYGDIFPALSKLEADSLSRQRTADIEAVETLGPRSNEALRTADPAKAGLLDRLTTDAQAGLDAGSRLTPEQQRGVQQASRSAFAARGLAHSPHSQLDEVLGASLAGNAEQDRRRMFAGNVINQRTQAYGDPFAMILGRPSGTMAAAQGFGAQAQGFNPGQLFNPESQYAADIFGSNAQQALAVGTANAANKTALMGAGMQAAGAAAPP